MQKNSFFLPPEWYPQSAILLTWPHRDSDWAPLLERVEPVFVKIACQIAAHQHVIIACFDEAHRQHVASILASCLMSHIHLYVVPSDDAWARDHGPITVFSGKKKILLDFIFNGWGNKFSAARDNQVTKNLYQQGAFDSDQFSIIDFVLEGGSIEVDGKGALLTTKRCLLSSTRNPTLSQGEIEAKLAKLFGIERFLWLEHGFLAGDDTDSHIDTLARFTDPETICYVDCDDPQDEHYVELNLMLKELKNFKNYQGKPYRLVPLPWPSAKYNAKKERLPATYANFLIANQVVLAPIYQDVMDEKALAQLQDCFPSRKVIGIDCLPLIEQGGSLHCVTMQMPGSNI
jgi:agmatine deiminase